MKLALFGPRLLIRCEAVDERKVGRVIITSNHSERTRFAEVVAIGDEVKHYAVGDKVMISWYTGSHVHILEDNLFGNKPDEDLDRFVMESEILGKVIPD